jgi:ribosome-associated protein
MDARKLALRCRELADAKKAENIVILDLRKLSSVADYFVIATGTSEPHLRAIVEDITEKLRAECALRPRATDGALRANWVVLDYDDVIVHVMRPETREFYDLESLWRDAPRVRARKAAGAKTPAKPRRTRPAPAPPS